jgi:hypothetical protein
MGPIPLRTMYSLLSTFDLVKQRTKKQPHTQASARSGAMDSESRVSKLSWWRAACCAPPGLPHPVSLSPTKMTVRCRRVNRQLTILGHYSGQ